MRIDGQNPDEIAAAIEAAQKSDKPTMIACKTTIGFGAPTKAGKSSAHGSPLGAEEIAGARKNLHWDSPPFEIPADIRDAWRIAGLRSSPARKDWEKRLAAADSNLRGEFERRMRGDLPPGFDEAITGLQEDARRRGPQGRHPQGLRDGARGHQRGRAGDDRRLGRPDALQQHPHQGPQGHQARRLRRPLHALGRARARHGRRHERHRAARRPDPLRRHLPGLLRLLPPGDPPRRPDGQPRDLRHDPRFDRSRRRRADPPAGRARGGAARHPQPHGLPPGRRHRDGSSAGSWRWKAATRRACWR